MKLSFSETRKWKHWTEEERSCLKKNYLLPKEILMSRFQRSWAAVKREACNLGLNRRGRKDHLKLDNLTAWEKGYLGGIIDGEGCITIERMKKGCLLPRITIKNTGRDLLKFVQDIIGGTIRKEIVRGNRKPCYKLTLPSNKDYLRWFFKQIKGSLILMGLENSQDFLLGKFLPGCLQNSFDFRRMMSIVIDNQNLDLRVRNPTLFNLKTAPSSLITS